MAPKTVSNGIRQEAKAFFEWMYADDRWSALDRMLYNDVKEGRRPFDDEISTMRLRVSASGLREHYDAYFSAKLSNNSKAEKALFGRIERSQDALRRTMNDIRAFIERGGAGGIAAPGALLRG